MVNTLKTTALLLFLAAGQLSFGQTDKELALSKAIKAVELMDNGKPDESIKLLKEAQKLDPDRFDYSYEMAYAYYIKKDYKGVTKILEKNKNHKDVTDRLFQLLGNTYDYMGETEKAFAAYDKGLEKFPNSGIIYAEKGNVYWNLKEYDKALSFYEKGIEVEPAYSSNYYRATRIYLNSSEEVWGMIYGEIFMNLERNTARTSEISELLFDTYKSEIKVTSDTSYSISFCSNTINMSSLSDLENFKLPYGLIVYEPILTMSVLAGGFNNAIDINSLDAIRSAFIDNYFNGSNDVNYPNVLFSYQKQIKEAGHIESYNHWLLMKGDQEGFDKWLLENQDKFDAFIEWYTSNGIQIDKSNQFYSGQY